MRRAQPITISNTLQEQLVHVDTTLLVAQEDKLTCRPEVDGMRTATLEYTQFRCLIRPLARISGEHY